MLKKRIVIVDDDAEDLLMVSDYLDDYGYKNVHLISDPEALLPYLESLSDHYLPDIILSDLNMPKINGMELLKRVKSSLRYQHIAFIICTTSSFSRDKDAAMAHGASYFFSKPIIYEGYLMLARAVSAIFEQSSCCSN